MQQRIHRSSAFGTKLPRKVAVRASVRDDVVTQKLRKATNADLKLIQERLWQERMNPLDIRTENFTVVDSPQGVIAFAQLQSISVSAATADTPRVYEFRSLVVDTRFRGQGIGSMLLTAVVSNRPDADIYLTTLASTTSFYQKAGFELLQASEVPRWMWFECVAGTVVARLAVNDQLVVMKRPGVPARADSSNSNSKQQ